MAPGRSFHFLTDEDLVAAAQRGEREALEELLGRHHDRVRGVATRLMGRSADAADATQEALIAIVRGLPKFDGRSRFSTWAYRVATNACLDELRRRGRRPIPMDDDVRPETATDARDAGAIDRIVLDDALAQLPEDYRVPVVLRDLVDLDYAEIAEVLDIPIGTVKSRIARGRDQLARRLGNPETSPGRPTPGAGT
ncbi:MAG: sigma-70 family RNA polymerase sigma factor [Ilumatobacteraceae bacterium]